MKTYFREAHDKEKEAKSHWGRWADAKFYEDVVPGAGSTFDEFNMTNGVTLWEGFKNKTGPTNRFAWQQMTRTKYFETTVDNKSLASRRVKEFTKLGHSISQKNLTTPVPLEQKSLRDPSQDGLNNSNS